MAHNTPGPLSDASRRLRHAARLAKLAQQSPSATRRARLVTRQELAEQAGQAAWRAGVKLAALWDVTIRDAQRPVSTPRQLARAERRAARDRAKPPKRRTYAERERERQAHIDDLAVWAGIVAKRDRRGQLAPVEPITEPEPFVTHGPGNRELPRTTT